MKKSVPPPLPPAPPERFSTPKQSGDPTKRIVFDTILGPNLRWKDNLYQGLVVLLGASTGALIGFYALPDEPELGAILGGIVGVLAAVFGSGLFLMVYRALMHMKGNHD